MRKPSPRETIVQGIQSMLQRQPSDVDINLGGSSGLGESPAVAEEAPVHSSRAADAPNSRYRVRTSAKPADVYINYVVLGESGVGKSTFIHNLVSGFKVVQPGSVGREGATTMQQFKANRNSLLTMLAPLDAPDTNQRLHITVQDMPGWGEDLNLRRYLHQVINFILSCQARDYDVIRGSSSSSSSSSGEKNGSSAGAKPRTTGGGNGRDSSSSSSDEPPAWDVGGSSPLQSSITACLYFVPPHRLKLVDVAMMAAVSQLVTVIPIIGKADAMTASELAEYRQVVTQMLQQPAKYLPEHGLQQLSVNTFNIDPTVLKALDLQQLPPAVACSRQKEVCSDEELLSMIGPQGLTHQAQPVRQYQWGAVYPFQRECQSDIVPLKRLLLGDQMSSLYVLMIDSYKRYWAFAKEFDEYSQELPALVQATCVLGRPLDYDDYRHVRASLAQTQSAKQMLQIKNKALSEELARAEAKKNDYAERLWRPTSRY